jgi:SAM-dependent methyltransferase
MMQRLMSYLQVAESLCTTHRRAMKRSDCAVSYDRSNRRLVYRGADADERHWDDQWAARLTPEAVFRGDRFVVAQTRKCLPVGSRILDAGCGLSQTVWGLSQAGYDAYGVDYAADTVRAVKQIAPELRVEEADVRALPFADAYFDGVWSLGVIEHFPDGFSAIIREMWRVLRPGGYAFVTVPSLSPLRRAKAACRIYPEFDGDMTEFYQFVLSPADIVRRFEADGWAYLGGCPRGGFKGLKDEAGPILPLLQRAYDGKSSGARYVRAVVNRVMAPVSFHTRFYRFRRPL